MLPNSNVKLLAMSYYGQASNAIIIIIIIE
jgi:hypothetical protein